MEPGAEARKAFDLHPDAVYLNVASEGPIPKAAEQVVREILDRKSNPFQLGDREYFETPRKTRKLCAGLVGARHDEIVLSTATGTGIHLAVNGLPLQAGDEIVYLKDDFPSLLNPILHSRRRGLVPVEARFSGRFPAPADYEKVFTSRTRLLAISHVIQFNGFRQDLEAVSRLCRDRGIRILVDAAQSVGTLPIPFDESGIDILAAPGHKWLLGFPGTAFVAIRRETMAEMTPPTVGWMGGMNSASQFIAIPPFDLSRFEGGRKFEIGTTPYLHLSAWNTSLELVTKVGPERIHEYAQRLLHPLWEYLKQSKYKLLSSEAAEHRSGILSFTGKYPAKLCLLLNKKKIFPGLRRGAIRVSAHFFNTEEDIQKLIDALKELEGANLEADKKGENV